MRIGIGRRALTAALLTSTAISLAAASPSASSSTRSSARAVTASEAPMVTLSSVHTSTNQSLRVDIDPDAGAPWTFTLQRRSGGAWRNLGPFTTKGTSNVKDLPASPGTYRVYVGAQNGHAASVSAEYSYTPQPYVIWSGAYSLIFDLEPNLPPGSVWTITLETRDGYGDWVTQPGWTWTTSGSTRSITAASGLQDGGEYRLRVDRNGRFPAYVSPARTYFRP